MAPSPLPDDPRGEPLDAIDRAVRDLMMVEADPAFRARVFARLERPGAGLLTWPRLAVAAGVAALVLAVVVGRNPTSGERESAGHRPDPVVTTTPARVPGGAVQMPQEPSSGPKASGRAPISPGSMRRRAPDRAEVRAVVASVAADRGPTIDIAPLAHLEPIEVIPMEQSPIAPAEIVIVPLAPITEVAITPLSPPVQRD
ncbi:MAG: hypothetical protein ACRD15_16805 [Vicinamibacterales bacterium]